MAENEELREHIAQWFDVRRYAACSDFDARDWYNCLFWRSVLFRVYLDEPMRIDAFDRVTQTLLAPLSPSSEKEPMFGKPRWQSVRALTVRDLLEWNDTLEHRDAEARKVLAHLHSMDDIEYDQYLAGSPSAIEREVLECWPGVFQDDFIPIGIDIGATDERIIADFRAWLKRARELQGKLTFSPPRQFTKADFGKWHRNAILPFLDLRALERLTGQRLTQQELGEYLFPGERYEGRDLAEVVRKTIEPMAEEVRRPATLEALQGQASAEMRQVK